MTTVVQHAGVLGSPIAHSLSPILHSAGYAACGLRDWRYGRREVTAGELAFVVGTLDDSWRGLSLTMPLNAPSVIGTAARMVEMISATMTVTFRSCSIPPSAAPILC